MLDFLHVSMPFVNLLLGVNQRQAYIGFDFANLLRGASEIENEPAIFNFWLSFQHTLELVLWHLLSERNEINLPRKDLEVSSNP